MSPKPSQPEVEYFAKEEVEKRHRLHELHEREHQKHDREEQNHIHHMKCGKCGGQLKAIRISFVDVDECTDCGALLLTKSELEKIKVADRSLLKSLTEFFKR